LFTCDRWQYEGYHEGEPFPESRSITQDEFRAFVMETFRRNVRFFSRDDLPFTIEKTSDEFFQAWQDGEEAVDVFGRNVSLGGPLSFCYVDGNHSYAFAKRDFANCDRFLETGGFILFDDSADDSDWEVRHVVREVLESGRYELVMKNPNYLVTKTVRHDADNLPS
jgi:hypothetical protein